MKRNGLALLPFLFLAFALPGFATEQLVPAGSLLQCRVAEPKLSSKTTEVGDPVLCQVSHVELYGRSVFPYGSYLVGRFEEYKDPGHLVGKGWMELKFERMVIPPDRVLPVSAKVVDVPKYAIDKQGRIHGKGHPVRDVIAWSIPVLWPIDLLNLPRRGPRPELKSETRLTVKLMDDLGVPMSSQSASANYYYPPAGAPQAPSGFSQRPSAPYVPQGLLDQRNSEVPVAPRPAWIPPRPWTVLMLRDGFGEFASDYWYEGDGRIRYIAPTGASVVISVEAIDLRRTAEVNRQRGVPFNLRSAAY